MRCGIVGMGTRSVRANPEKTPRLHTFRWKLSTGYPPRKAILRKSRREPRRSIRSVPDSPRRAGHRQEDALGTGVEGDLERPGLPPLLPGLDVTRRESTMLSLRIR